MIITHDLLEQIDEKRRKIAGSPDSYLIRDKKVKNALRRMANTHTYWLENPDLRRKILTENGTDDSGDLRKTSKESIKRIKEAWKFLNPRNNNDSGFDYVNPQNILGVGSILDPRINVGYRDSMLKPYLRDHIPPNKAKIPELVDKFCSDLNGSDLHPVEAATQCHLCITGIQPLLVGNKRTARLFQDTVLHQNGLPPAFIPSGEREVYIGLMNRALVGYRDKRADLQRPFFDYVGGKVNVALDSIIDDLK